MLSTSEVTYLLVVHDLHPVRAAHQSRIVGRLPARDGVQVGGIQSEPPAEFTRIPDVAVTGHHMADVRHRRQPLHPGAVGAERIGRHSVQQGDLHVGAHVAGDQDASIGKEHSAVSRSVPVVHDHLGGWPVPGNDRGVKRLEPPDQREIMSRNRLLEVLDHAVPLGFGHGHCGGRGVPGRIPKLPAPQHVIPVWMRGPRDRGPEPQVAERGRQLGQVGQGHGRVDEQAAARACRADDNGRRRDRVRTGRDEHPRRDLGQASHRTGIPRAELRVVPSRRGDDDLAACVPLLHIAQARGHLGQRVRPVEDRRELPVLDEPGEGE
jgi:hypothetical protein